MWISHCKKSSCIYNIASFGISRLPQKGISNVAVVKPIDKFLLVCGLSSLKARHISLKKAGVFSTVRHPKISNREKAIVTSLNLCNVWPDNIVPHGNTKSLFTTEGIGCDEPLKREKLWINSSGEMFFSLLTVFF